jgi:guanyl-specific ribonuclease Sa
VQLAVVGVVALALLVAYLLTRPGQPTSATASSTTVATGQTRSAVTGTDPVSGLAWVRESALPVQARDTLALIAKGGPYPFPRNDDKTFGNLEGILPKHPSGYYKEYTVITPGSPDRGARRIIVGSGGEKFYTDDHYASFRRISEGR